MYEREVDKIIALLQEGHDAEARALFMTLILDHCRALDHALGEVLGWAPNTDDYLWQVFQGALHVGWFHCAVELRKES
jgi:hypothetical protein